MRSVSTLNSLCEKFDSESGVPGVTSAHSTRSDEADMKKVVTVVLEEKILEPDTQVGSTMDAYEAQWMRMSSC